MLWQNVIAVLCFKVPKSCINRRNLAASSRFASSTRNLHTVRTVTQMLGFYLHHSWIPELRWSAFQSKFWFHWYLGPALINHRDFLSQQPRQLWWVCVPVTWLSPIQPHAVLCRQMTNENGDDKRSWNPKFPWIRLDEMYSTNQDNSNFVCKPRIPQHNSNSFPLSLS